MSNKRRYEKWTSKNSSVWIRRAVSLQNSSANAARAAQKVYPVCGSSLVLRFLVHVGDIPRNNCDHTHHAHTRVCFAGQDDSSSLSPRLRARSIYLQYLQGSCLRSHESLISVGPSLTRIGRLQSVLYCIYEYVVRTYTLIRESELYFRSET